MLRIHLLIAWLVLPIASIIGIAPVHPDAPDYYLLRERHNRQKYFIQPDLLHPGICDGLSEETCIQWDNEMKSNARNLQNIQKTSGFVRVLVLQIKFTDHADRPSEPIEDYTKVFNDPGETVNVTDSGSVSSWLLANSYGRFNFEAEVVPWKMSDNTEEYYSFGKSGVTHELRFMMYPVLDQLDAEGFDFSRFDLDKDGKIDSIIILHSGYSAEIGGQDCYTEAVTENRIWSHAIGYSDDNWQSKDGSMRANSYVVNSAYWGLCYFRLPRIAIIVHEFMHTLGLPDLNDNSGEWIGRGLGNFDVMANAHARNGAQLYPAHLSPWCKKQVNWMNPIEITQDGEYDMVATELEDNYLLIKSPYPDGEYLYIENRQPIKWDALLWTGGILLWHIDEKKDRQTERGFPGQDNWPGNNKHYLIAVEPADHFYDLEKGNNDGDEGDYWIQGMVYGPGPTDNTAEVEQYNQYPNSNSYQDGIISQTGFSVEILTPSQETMRIRVTGLSPTFEPTIRPTPQPTMAATPSPSRLPIPEPTPGPTPLPTLYPTAMPSNPPFTSSPTISPTMSPITSEPTNLPTAIPSTAFPTAALTNSPTSRPTPSPSVSAVTVSPSTAGTAPTIENGFQDPFASPSTASAAPVTQQLANGAPPATMAPNTFSPHLPPSLVGSFPPGFTFPPFVGNGGIADVSAMKDDQIAAIASGLTSTAGRWTWSLFVTALAIFVGCLS